MKTLKSLIIVITTGTMLSAVSISSHAMDEYIESALIEVCKSTLTNNVTQFNKVTKAYNLQTKTIAMKVMCNGDDIITFAEKHNANKTASRLERSMQGSVNIIDVAAIEKTNVNFAL